MIICESNKFRAFWGCLLLSIFVSLCPARADGQIEKSLRFIPESLDFGTIRETDPPVTKTLIAVNVSPDSTFIISARTSCGCSMAEFDGRMMAPGDSTTVSITYDPTNRPGVFQKTAKIFTGKDRISNMFKIKGKVIPSKKHLDKSYPEHAGDLRLSTLFVNVGEIRPSESRPVFVGVYNNSDSPIKLSVDSDSDAIEATMQPEELQPFDIGTISIMVKGGSISGMKPEFKLIVTVANAETMEKIVEIPVCGSLVR